MPGIDIPGAIDGVAVGAGELFGAGVPAAEVVGIGICATAGALDVCMARATTVIIILLR